MHRPLIASPLLSEGYGRRRPTDSLEEQLELALRSRESQNGIVLDPWDSELAETAMHRESN